MNDKPSILVVEDEQKIRTALRDFLELEGYGVEAVASGEEGIEKLSVLTPDLVVLDIALPGMGGVAFLRQMSGMATASRIPVIVFTARAAMKEFFEDIEVAGFIAKPCEPADLLREIRRVLGEGPPKPKLRQAPPVVR